MDCIALQALLSMGFSRQEYWSGLRALIQGIFLTQGLNPCLLHWQAGSFTGATWKAPYLSERPSNEMVCIVEVVSSLSLEIYNTATDARPLRLEGGSRPGSPVPFLIEGQHRCA